MPTLKHPKRFAILLTAALIGMTGVCFFTWLILQTYAKVNASTKAYNQEIFPVMKVDIDTIGDGIDSFCKTYQQKGGNLDDCLRIVLGHDSSNLVLGFSIGPCCLILAIVAGWFAKNCFEKSSPITTTPQSTVEITEISAIEDIPQKTDEATTYFFNEPNPSSKPEDPLLKTPSTNYETASKK